MKITLNEAAKQCLEQDKFLVLSHRAPDGDTLGSASALCTALHRMGKQVRFACSDEIGKKYEDLFSEIQEFTTPEEGFAPEWIISVDLADVSLLGDNLAAYADKVDLCIDHHRSNGDFAKYSYVDSTAAATGEIIYDLLGLMKVEMDRKIAACLYTAISTDTGCFQYANTTPRTMRIAADLMEWGADAADINRRMFDTLTRARLELERRALDQLDYFYEGRCVTMEISRSMLEETGAKGSDLDGITSLPRKIEGALVGITIRERKDGGHKLSLRGQPPVDCSAICEEFGGGGHKGAAGCAFDQGTVQEIKETIVAAVGRHLKALGLWEAKPKEQPENE